MRYSILPVCLFFFLCSFSAVYAVPTASLSVPPDGEFCYWFSYSDVNGKEVSSVPRTFKDKSITVELPLVKDAVPKSRLFVLDVKTGNEAVIDIAAKPEKALKFKLNTSDFNRVRRVRVEVFSLENDRPVAYAVVELKDSDDKTASRLIEPSSFGAVDFFDVAAGMVNLSARYSDGRSASQDFDVALEREDIVKVIKLPVAGEVDTLKPLVAGDKSGGRTGSAAGGDGAPNDSANYLMMLMAAALTAAIIYIIVREIRSKGAGAGKVLKGIGIDLPSAASSDDSGEPAPLVEPGVCPFCGGKKDPVSGNCACSEAAPTGDGPRLVAAQGPYMGNVYILQQDDTTIGREETNDIAFPLDSTSSRNHARISGDKGLWKIFDLDSSNGTFVNGVKVTEQVLASGDEIQVGSSRLRFEI